MLVFWTLERDDSDYNIISNVEFISTNKTLTESEQNVNFALGTLFIFCFLISSSLNPILVHHHRSKRGITNFLFTSLAISDFLSNLFSPLVYAYFAMKLEVVALVSPIMAPFGAIACAAGCLSQCSTTILAVTRFLKIVNPFVRIKKRLVISYLVLYNIFMFAINAMKAVTIYTKVTGLPFFVPVKICAFVTIIHCLIGIIFSAFTVIYVHFIKPVSQTDHVTRRVCGTILLMNVVYIVNVCCSLLPIITYLGLIPMSSVSTILYNLVFCSYFVMPFLTSAWNPIVLFARVQTIRQTFKQILVFRRQTDGNIERNYANLQKIESTDTKNL